MGTKFYRRPDVESRYGVSRSTIYSWVSKGVFPKPIRIGPRAVGWLVDDLDAFDRSRIAERREAA